MFVRLGDYKYALPHCVYGLKPNISTYPLRLLVLLTTNDHCKGFFVFNL